MSIKKTRVAVNGCGSVSNMYLPHLAKSPFVELVSGCDIIAQRVDEQARKYSIPNQFTKLADMLEGPKVDLFVNLSNMQEHGLGNRQALEHGIHVWSEKPMATNFVEGKMLLTLAKSRGVHIWAAPAVTTSPQFAFMARQLAEKKLGNVAAAHGRYGHEGPEWSSFWYEEGGGSMPDLGVYNILTLTGLLGSAMRVTAMTGIVTPQRLTPNKGLVDVAVEDNAMLLLDHGNGVLSHIMCGFNYFDPYGHAGTGQDKATISIFGSTGNMHLIGYDWGPGGVDISTKEEVATHRYATDTQGFVWEQGASLIAEHLATGKEISLTSEHALHVVEIIEAARESEKFGRHIALESTFPWPLKLTV